MLYLLKRGISWLSICGVCVDDGWFQSQTDWTLGLGEAGRSKCVEVEAAISTHTHGETSCMATWITRSCSIVDQLLQ